MDELSCSLFISYFFCNVHGSFVAGEKENLLFLPQFHKEAESFPLPFFVKTDENVIQHNGQRFDLLSEGKSHGQADGKEYLVAGTGGPDFSFFTAWVLSSMKISFPLSAM